MVVNPLKVKNLALTKHVMNSNRRSIHSQPRKQVTGVNFYKRNINSNADQKQLTNRRR